MYDSGARSYSDLGRSSLGCARGVLPSLFRFFFLFGHSFLLGNDGQGPANGLTLVKPKACLHSNPVGFAPVAYYYRGLQSCIQVLHLSLSSPTDVGLHTNE